MAGAIQLGSEADLRDRTSRVLSDGKKGPEHQVIKTATLRKDIVQAVSVSIAELEAGRSSDAGKYGRV